MFGILLFLHLTSLAIWLGSIIVSALLLKATTKGMQTDTGDTIVKQVTKFISMLTHPSAFLMLLTGVWMLIIQNDDAQQFWLQYMQGLGTLIIVGFIIAISIFSSKLKKNLNDPQTNGQTKGLSAYVNTLNITAILILSIIFVVAMKY